VSESLFGEDSDYYQWGARFEKVDRWRDMKIEETFKNADSMLNDKPLNWV
jgi:hypothetical protein